MAAADLPLHDHARRQWIGDDDTSAVMISDDQGASWTEHPVPDSTGCVHMNVLDLRDGTLLAFFRSRWADNIYVSRSHGRRPQLDGAGADGAAEQQLLRSRRPPRRRPPRHGLQRQRARRTRPAAASRSTTTSRMRRRRAPRAADGEDAQRLLGRAARADDARDLRGRGPHLAAPAEPRGRRRLLHDQQLEGTG